MENAVNALKIAFAVMVFTMALTLAISTFSQARETSEAVLYMNDKTNYYDWEVAEYDETTGVYTIPSEGITYRSKRIVGIETIIPTLYRYYKENYTVIFVDERNNAIPIYNVNDDGKWVVSGGVNSVNYFDLNKEITSNCPWVGTVNDIKKNLDLFLKGTAGLADTDKSFGNINRKVKYEYGSVSSGFIREYRNATFLEELGEYATDRVDGNIESTYSTYKDPESGEIIELAKPTIKRVIKYTLIENNP